MIYILRLYMMKLIFELCFRLAGMRKVFATLRALIEVMKELSKDAAPEVGKLIMEEVCLFF